MVAMADVGDVEKTICGEEEVNKFVRLKDVLDIRDFSGVDLEEERTDGDGIDAVNEEGVESVVEEEEVGEKSDLVGVDLDLELKLELVHPHEQLPKPEAPRGLTDLLEDGDDVRNVMRSVSLTENLSVDVPAIGKFIRERSSSFSTALAKRLSSTFKDTNISNFNQHYSKASVTEINLSGMKVIVKSKDDGEAENGNGDISDVKGRISFFSRSNCRDCRAVRTFFREKGLKFVEINIDVFTNREKELIQRTGSSAVPQIFFNEKLLGGLVVLNSLRNSGQFDERMREMLVRKCPDEAPAPPVYGFDEEGAEGDQMDEMIGIVRVLRQRLPIQDRLMKMKIVKNCFAGSELVEVIIHHMDCGRKKVC